MDQSLRTQTKPENRIYGGHEAFLGKRNSVKESKVLGAKADSPENSTNIKSSVSAQNIGLPSFFGEFGQEKGPFGANRIIQPTFSDINEVLDKAGGRSTLGELARRLSERSTEPKQKMGEFAAATKQKSRAATKSKVCNK